MGQKDMTEKILEEYNDVFADIYNVLVFGQEVLDEERLRDSATESVYKAEDGEYREQRRDVMKTYLDEYQMELAFVGIDNQTSVDKYIPVRVLGYDYTKYRRQVDEKVFPLLPVITLVLNFSDRKWNGCKSLAEITKVPPEFKSIFQDYKVKVVDVAFLEDDVIEQFKSDFKLVAMFFKNRRLGVESWNDEIQIKHVTALIDFIAAFANDKRYRNVKEDLEKINAKGEKIGMCEYLDMLLAKGEARGERKMIKLTEYLLSNEMMEELQKALVDEDVRAQMYEEYGINTTIDLLSSKSETVST